MEIVNGKTITTIDFNKPIGKFTPEVGEVLSTDSFIKALQKIVGNINFLQEQITKLSK